jgi:hypothetical protein
MYVRSLALYRTSDHFTRTGLNVGAEKKLLTLEKNTALAGLVCCLFTYELSEIDNMKAFTITNCQ